MARRHRHCDDDELGSSPDIDSDTCTSVDYKDINIEKGQLAISMNDELVKREKDIWTNPIEKLPVKYGGIILRFTIKSARLNENIENNNGASASGQLNEKRYVIYNLCIHQDSIETDKNPTYIERRYTDFLNLYGFLRKEFPDSLNNIYFPKKVLMGNFSSELIAERGSAFENLLEHVVASPLRESSNFINFLQDNEILQACRYLDERRNEMAVPILENTFRLLNKIFLDRSRPVLLSLCRLVAACTTSPVPHSSAEYYTELALRRYEGVSDTELLSLYIPLLHTAQHLWWQKGRDKTLITQRLNDMEKRGINISVNPTLSQGIHKLDPRTETM